MPSRVSGRGTFWVSTHGFPHVSPLGKCWFAHFCPAPPLGLLCIPLGGGHPKPGFPQGIPRGEPEGADPDPSRLRGWPILFHIRSDPKRAFPHASPLGERKKHAFPHVCPQEDCMFRTQGELIFSKGRACTFAYPFRPKTSFPPRFPPGRGAL